MSTVLYSVTPDGSVYSTSVEDQSTSLLFRCFIDKDQPAIGIASTSSQIFILKNVDSKARLLCYGRNGQFLNTVDLVVTAPVADLAFWPGNHQLLLTTCSLGVYALALDTMTSRLLPFAMTRGIAAVTPEAANPSVASFYVGLGRINGYIHKVSIDSSAWTLEDQGAFARRLHPTTSGLAVPTSESTPTIYAVNPEGGRSALHSFTQGIPTTASIKTRLAELPFVAAGLDAPVTAGESPAPTSTALLVITTLLYDAAGAATIVDGVSFGVGAPTTLTSTSCVSLKINGGPVTISNVKLGLLEAKLPAAMRVSHKSDWDPEMIPVGTFPGLSDGTPDCPNNVVVGTRVGINGTVTESDYIYLAALVPPGFLDPGRVVFKWFFDFE